MSNRFDYFTIYAAMRTGSNFLEENINEYPDLHCYGEAFNPLFMGGAEKHEMLGVSIEERDGNPEILLDRMRSRTKGLPGFRFFHDHDPRILEMTLADPRCGKIVLTRNPVDSYVSRKIAAATGQWRLSNMKGARTAQITFDRDEFEQHLDRLQEFQLRLLRGMQTTGQTAYYIGYDDLRDLEVLDGLAAYLGVSHSKDHTSKRTKVQNPAPLEDKVANFDDMQAALARIDRFDLTRTPNFEPRRAATVPSYVAAAKAPVLYQPIKAGPGACIHSWLAALDGDDKAGLLKGFNQKTLRQWKRRHPGNRSFTVLRHPVARLHRAFVNHILCHGPDTYWDMRTALRNSYGLPIPEDTPDESYSVGQHREAFLAFTKFVQGNLGGQTGVRVDAAWASQTEVLHGFATVLIPDMVLREDSLEMGLEQLAKQIGMDPPSVPDEPHDAPVSLAEIYDDAVEEAVQAAYRKDYLMFGFRPLDL